MGEAIEKAKRIEAEKQLAVARRCIESIANGHSRDPERDAKDAIDEMFRVGLKQPLQGLVGHKSY